MFFGSNRPVDRSSPVLCLDEEVMIEYRDASEPIDLEQLATPFDSVGWQHRTRDPERLAQMVRGSTYGVSAHVARGSWATRGPSTTALFNAYVRTVAVLPAYQRQGIGSEPCSERAR
jgi:ribosomal protein S18 acetylase RimI-like enzyme